MLFFSFMAYKAPCHHPRPSCSKSYLRYLISATSLIIQDGTGSIKNTGVDECLIVSKGQTFIFRKLSIGYLSSEIKISKMASLFQDVKSQSSSWKQYHLCLQSAKDLLLRFIYVLSGKTVDSMYKGRQVSHKENPGWGYDLIICRFLISVNIS